ncbi:evolutionarily conserved signaling intermediate in Toll pathway, mitochondrial-like [Dreissena polymorpha]|nr:evolutionarily conserved signaling intermediate in Toll pathway, mitochondrial-like [Dreissena polymorpha]
MFLSRINRSKLLKYLVTISSISKSKHPHCGIGSEHLQVSNNLRCNNFSLSSCVLEQNNSKAMFQEYYTAVLTEVHSNERLKAVTNFQHLSDPILKERALKKWIFIEAVNAYLAKNGENRRGYVEFIYDALEQMKPLEVHRDLDCYKALISIFPKGMMIPQNVWQHAFSHYPKQQDCMVEILEQLEHFGVIPDTKVQDAIEEIFGTMNNPMRKYRRIYYMTRKFQNRNPYKLPYDLPVDPIQLAVLALRKMAVDLENELKVWKVSRDENSKEKLFIASAQSPLQREMIHTHPESKPIYVEGGYRVWLRDIPQTFFVMRTDTDPSIFVRPTEEEELENLFDFDTIFDSEKPKQLALKPNVHQQEEGTILGMCITETSCKDSLISWIRCLQEANPRLESIPIVFSLATPSNQALVLRSEGMQPSQQSTNSPDPS